MKVLGYIRVSSKMQSEKGYSLKNQSIKIKEYCQFMDYELMDLFDRFVGEPITTRHHDGRYQYVEIYHLFL